MLHQKNNCTLYNRYPEIFKIVSDLNNIDSNVLSFGCSSGEEIETLKNVYNFNNVYGVDIHKESINICRNKFGNDFIFDYDIDFLDDNKKFDIIFAMSVLCKWEDTELINDSTNVYPFYMFDNAISILDKKLNNNGLLIIYNANYMFKDSSVYDNYIPLEYDLIKDSGFVHKFDKNNNKISNDYNHVIFKKK